MNRSLRYGVSSHFLYVPEYLLLLWSIYTHLSNNVYKWTLICFFKESFLYVYKTYILKAAPPLSYRLHLTHTLKLLSSFKQGWMVITL